MAKVFYYKGFVGIECYPDSPAIITPPGNKNIGVVCDGSKMEISEEALEELKKIRKGRDDIGDVDVFGAGDGMVVFGWLGGYLKVFKSDEIQGSRSYNANLLSATPGVEPSEDFKDFINSYLIVEDIKS